MAVSFKIPKSPAKSIETIDNFLGVDLTNSPANVDETKSPNAINMIRDVPGKVRKRMGYEVIEDWTDESRYTVNEYNTLFESFDIVTGEKDDIILHVKYREGDKSIVFSGMGESTTFKIGGNTHLKKGDYTLAVYQLGGTTTVPSILSPESLVRVKDANTHSTYVFREFSLRTPFEWRVATFTLSEDKDIYITFDTHAGVTYNNTNYAVAIYNGYLTEERLYKYVPYGKGYPTEFNVNGYHSRRNDKYAILHIGERMYRNGVIMYDGANNARSHSWQFGDNLYIIDGKKMLVYNDEDGLVPVEEVAYVPTITIAKTQQGKADSYEDFNLLTPAFIETFIAESTQKAFQMNFAGLDDTEVLAWVLNSNGDWIEKKEGTHFSVNRTTGVVTFTTAPGGTPITGEPNVKIQAYRTVDGYAERINHCTFGTRFGVNGAFDRLFLSGNPDHPNTDWHSDQWGCTYFPDTGYSLLGSAKSAIVGYSIISNYLAAHKDEQEEDLSIIIREGDLVDNEATFKIINTLQGEGAIASNSFAYLCTEPIFLTRSGLYAVTAQDITGEKYTQSRSFYLNGKLTKEKYEDLADSVACVYDNMYLLSVAHDRLYVLDGIQPIRTDKSEPYSNRQYAAFYCDNLPINTMWQSEHRLYFGTVDGKICRFYNDKENIHSYNDNGNPIVCQWETPDIDGNLFYKNKTLRYLAVRVGAALRTSMKIYSMSRGLWKYVKEDESLRADISLEDDWQFVKADNTFARYFAFDDIDFSKFSFKTDKTQQISRTKMRVKKVDKFRIRLVNDQVDEPFTLYNMAMEFIENGNYKG